MLYEVNLEMQTVHNIQLTQFYNSLQTVHNIQLTQFYNSLYAFSINSNMYTNINIKPSKNNNLQETISTKITNIHEKNIPVVIRQTHLHTVYYVTNTLFK